MLGRFFAHRGREVWHAGAVPALGRIVSIALITAGLVVLADVGLTLAYREPVSSIYASIEQGKARGPARRPRVPLPQRRRPARPARRLRIPAARSRSSPAASRGAAETGTRSAASRCRRWTGSTPSSCREPAPASLQKGPGHYPQTPFPGQPGTVAIAGHRTTYLAPFRHIDDLRRGDAIRLEMPYATFVYRVQRTRVVDPGDVGIVRPAGYDRLVLSACHPLYSAAHRFIAFARLRRVSRATGS